MGQVRAFNCSAQIELRFVLLGRLLLMTTRPSDHVHVNVQNPVNKVMALLLGVRDYIHVVDLAKGHIAALKKLKEDCGCKVGIRKEEKQKHFLLHCAFT